MTKRSARDNYISGMTSLAVLLRLIHGVARQSDPQQNQAAAQRSTEGAVGNQSRAIGPATLRGMR
jgi:hypothetical protein